MGISIMVDLSNAFAAHCPMCDGNIAVIGLNLASFCNLPNCQIDDFYLVWYLVLFTYEITKDQLASSTVHIKLMLKT